MVGAERLSAPVVTHNDFHFSLQTTNRGRSKYFVLLPGANTISLFCLLPTGETLDMVIMLFMASALLVLSRYNRLHKLNYLTYVYPNRPKDEVFGSYYTPERMCFEFAGTIFLVCMCWLPAWLFVYR